MTVITVGSKYEVYVRSPVPSHMQPLNNPFDPLHPLFLHLLSLRWYVSSIYMYATIVYIKCNSKSTVLGIYAFLLVRLGWTILLFMPEMIRYRICFIFPSIKMLICFDMHVLINETNRFVWKLFVLDGNVWNQMIIDLWK